MQDAQAVVLGPFASVHAGRELVTLEPRGSAAICGVKVGPSWSLASPTRSWR